MSKIIDTVGFESIEIYGAKEHNLKNVTTKIPRNKLVVMTGISGSGKSSLAFDTIYAEGQRRYTETFSAYARSFLGNLQRPNVDKINGLSPVISIEQKTTVRNPRSTVGTTTEIYDFLRLLFARAGKAYSYHSNKEMIKFTEQEIIDIIYKKFKGVKIVIMAPVVKGRKGHYRELFLKIRKQGYTKVRIDGKFQEIKKGMQVDRYKIHDIEIIVDEFEVNEKDIFRLNQSVKSSLKSGNGLVLVKDDKGVIHHFSKELIDAETGLSYDEPAPNTFSFNSPYGYCPECRGLGQVEDVNENSLIPNPSLSILKNGIPLFDGHEDTWIYRKVTAYIKKRGVNLSTPLKDYPEDVLHGLLHGVSEKISVKSKNYDFDKKLWLSTFNGIIPFIKSNSYSNNNHVHKWANEYLEPKVCPVCNGSRLKKIALYFKIADKNIFELASLTIDELVSFFSNIEVKLDAKQNIIAKEILKEIRKRLFFLHEVGLEYLDLNRPLRTLSGGESQRIRLATQIGTQLVGVLYILDEPSIGLHQRDNHKLITALKKLRDLGNSIIVVEHDKDIMLASDFIMDIGPGAGLHGGEVLAAKNPKEFLKTTHTTAKYLSGKKKIEIPSKLRKGNGKHIIIKGAKGNNLKDITVKFPLEKMILVTGVSGSGKSTLVHDTLYVILHTHLNKVKKESLPFKDVKGLEHINKIIEVNQAPIGRTPRSNPATYTGMFTLIRTLFSELPEAKIRGYKMGRFSFNVKGGRCETCKGAGVQTIEMGMLPPVLVNCETCTGKRYNRETLEVRYKGKSISNVLDMTVEEALHFFEAYPKIRRNLQTLHDVGLNYISLGQHATTISGGEAQRVKLSKELSKKDTGTTFYILDEPTTGLHFQDVDMLLKMLHKLVDRGNTVLIIEHNMDIIKSADYIIDLGPEGGHKGGYVVAEGTPMQIVKKNKGYTAQFLKKEL